MDCSSSDEDENGLLGTTCIWVLGCCVSNGEGEEFKCGGLSRRSLPRGVRKGFLLPGTALRDSMSMLVLSDVLNIVILDDGQRKYWRRMDGNGLNDNRLDKWANG